MLYGGHRWQNSRGLFFGYPWNSIKDLNPWFPAYKTNATLSGQYPTEIAYKSENIPMFFAFRSSPLTANRFWCTCMQRGVRIWCNESPSNCFQKLQAPNKHNFIWFSRSGQWVKSQPTMAVPPQRSSVCDTNLFHVIENQHRQQKFLVCAWFLSKGILVVYV